MNLGDGIFDGAAYLTAGGAFGVGSDFEHPHQPLRGAPHASNTPSACATAPATVLAPPTPRSARVLFEGASPAARGPPAAPPAPSPPASGRPRRHRPDGDALAPARRDGRHLLDGFVFAADDRVVRDVWSAGRRVVTGGRHIARDRVAARYRRTMSDLMARM